MKYYKPEFIALFLQERVDLLNHTNELVTAQKGLIKYQSHDPSRNKFISRY